MSVFLFNIWQHICLNLKSTGIRGVGLFKSRKIKLEIKSSELFSFFNITHSSFDGTSELLSIVRKSPKNSRLFIIAAK